MIDSAESFWPLCPMCLSIRWPAVILRGRPLGGWVVVVPNCFHCVIIPLTVDCGIFRSEDISRLDLLHRWHPITAPHWNSLSSWERHILSQMFVETVCVPRCCFLYTCSHGSDWNTWFKLFGWVSEYFWHYSVRALTYVSNIYLFNVLHYMFQNVNICFFSVLTHWHSASTAV